jgi:hypothetical protein
MPAGTSVFLSMTDEKQSRVLSPRCLAMFVLSLWLMTGLSSCSMVVLSQGKKLEKVIHGQATKTSLARELGAPVFVRQHQHALTLGACAEVKAAPSHERPREISQAVVTEAEYRFQGLVYQAGAAQAAGMVTGMTFFLGEPFALAMAFDHVAKERKAVHFFHCWFGRDGRLVACRCRKPGVPDMWWPNGSLSGY